MVDDDKFSDKDNLIVYVNDVSAGKDIGRYFSKDGYSILMS